MATVMERLDAVPLERISTRAETVDLRRTLLSLIALLVIGIFWCLRKACIVAAACARWLAAAAMEGWAMAGPQPDDG